MRIIELNSRAPGEYGVLWLAHSGHSTNANVYLSIFKHDDISISRRVIFN